jgi:hypothetical protein
MPKSMFSSNKTLKLTGLNQTENVKQNENRLATIIIIITVVALLLFIID